MSKHTQSGIFLCLPQPHPESLENKVFKKKLEGALLATYFIPGNLKDLSDEIVVKLLKEFQTVLHLVLNKK